MKIGVILVPLDLRLKAAEVIRSLCLVKPKGYAFLGKDRARRFRELAKAVRAECPFIEYFVQFSAPDETLPDAPERLRAGRRGRGPWPRPRTPSRAAPNSWTNSPCAAWTWTSTTGRW